MDDKNISSTTTYLQNTYFGETKHKKLEIKYVKLNTQDIFNQLVSLYSNFFKSNFPRTQCTFPMSKRFEPSISTYIARLYLSHWLMDLYVTNQELLSNMGLTDFPSFYIHRKPRSSATYDCYLAELNAQIRPVQLNNTTEDLLYVPVISKNPAFGEDNPFDIEGFEFSCFHFNLSMCLLLEATICKMKSLSGNVWEKPTWLLDWHGDGAFAWFPQHGNDTMDDITIAFVLGIACTENLGIADYDEWQDIPEDGDGLFKLTFNPDKCLRITKQVQHGACEFRNAEFDDLSDFSGKEVPRFRLVDWIYHRQVICKVDDQARFFAHRMILSLKSG